MSRKKRDLTEDEMSLWGKVVQKVKPLPKHKKRIAPDPISPSRPPRKKAPFTLPEAPLVAPKTSHQIQRVRKVEIEARLDLHGLTLQEARLKLAKFLIRAQQNRRLWVLIITGKGKPQTEAKEPVRRTLRNQLPLWLEEPFFHGIVSAYTTAKPQDGGSGALYVRLKRLHK